MMHIEWRPCVGFPGYEVANVGLVRSVFWSKYNPQANKLLRPDRNSNGYSSIQLLVAPKKQKRVQLHRLVCEAFHGARPMGMEVRHLDGTKLNAHESNLAWGTRSENAKDAVKHGTCRILHRTPETEARRLKNLRIASAIRWGLIRPESQF